MGKNTNCSLVNKRSLKQGECLGKLQAYLAHLDSRPPVVITLHSATAGDITDPTRESLPGNLWISSGEVYTSKVHCPPQDLLTFLEILDLPKLSAEQVDLLDSPISADQITLALAQFAKAKDPCSDGLPFEFCAHFSDVLVPRLLPLYQAIFKATTLPESVREAIIIPKLGKNPHSTGSYRPISLLQTDITILDKILSLRLNKVILSLIHSDQTGSMPAKTKAFNTRRLFMNLQAFPCPNWL